MSAILDDYLSDLMDPGPAVPAAPSPSPAATAPPPVPEVKAPAPAAAPVRPAPVAPPPAKAPHPAIAALLGQSSSPGAPNGRNDRVDRRAGDRRSTWLRFEVCGQVYAVEVLKVQEVLRLPEILPLRGTPGYVMGMMNLRGQVVPVLDLGLRLGLLPVRQDPCARVIVLEQSGDAMGLLVDAVADVGSISEGAIEPLQGPLAGIGGEMLRGMARRNGQTVTLLDAGKLLG